MVGVELFEQALLEGTREVFETMMFMTVEEANELYEGIEGQALLGSITFQGELEGCLGICCSIESAKIMAKNMLGMDAEDEIASEEIPDAMGEIANMVMGSIKTRIQDQVSNVQVSIPTVVSGIELENSLGDGSQEIMRTVNIDDFVVRLTLFYRASK